MEKEFIIQPMRLDSQITICGKEYVEIENCKRIMEYNDIYLKVKTAGGLIIEVWGSGLRLSDYNTNGIAVRGIISSVELH
ncbi:MAG: YabP/YqfC family sporulation protein [Huintestinicola sp.]